MSPYIPRLADPMVESLMGELPAIFLQGPRACGKTTTALQHTIAELRLDEPGQAAAFSNAPDMVLQNLPSPLLIDEWQEVPESLAAIKRAIDSGSGAGRFIVTGSVRSRVNTATWPATGRIAPLDMYGLTVGEITRSTTQSSTITRLFAEQGPVPKLFADAPTLLDYIDWIVKGGFPEAANLSDFARQTWHRGYVEQLVHRDIADLAQIKNPAALNRLFRALAINTAGTITIASLTEASQLTHLTAQTYLGLLEELRMVKRLEPWWTNQLKRLGKAPKYHLTDTGLAAYLTGQDRKSLLKDGQALGRLMETFVLMQILPLLPLSFPQATAYHLRDKNGEHEVDLVLESLSGEIVGIEVKSSQTIREGDHRHLSWLRDRNPDRFVRGVVLYTGNATYELEENIWAMPIAQLWQ